MELRLIAQERNVFPQYKVFQKYANEVLPSRPDNLLKLDVVTALELGIDFTNLPTVLAQDVADIATMGTGPTSGKAPFLEAVDLPGLYTGLSVSDTRAAVQAFVPEMERSLREKFGFKLLNVYGFPAIVLWCRSSVNSLDDLRGKRIRVFSASTSDLFSAVGAQPVTLDSSEVYSALERGVIDCAITGVSAGNSSRWFEVTKTLYTLNLGSGLTFTAMKIDRFEKLPADVQSQLVRVMKEIEDEVWKLHGELLQDSIDCNTGSASCKLGIQAPPNQAMTEVKPSTADVQRLKDILSSAVLPKWVSRCGEPTCVSAFNQTLGAKLGIVAK